MIGACSQGAAHKAGQDAASGDSGGSGGSATGGSSRTDSFASGGGAGLDAPMAGTGGGGGAARDAGVGADQATDLPVATNAEQVCRDAILAQCERGSVCQQGSSADCLKFAARCPDYYFNPHTLRTIENVAACVPIIRQATCTDIAMGLSTQCLLGGIGAAGDPCSSSSECASTRCSASYPSCGTCYAPVPLGGACSTSSGCVSGARCHPGTGLCVAAPIVITHAAAGQACDSAGNPPVGCEGDLICVPPTRDKTAGTCTPLPQQGEKCLDMNPMARCAPGLSCGIARSSGLRIATCGNPAPCGYTVCAAGSYCYESPEVINECRPYAAPGEACNDSNYGEKVCAPGALCVGDADAGVVSQGVCVVVTEVGLGAACSETSTCKSPSFCQAGRCTSFDPASCYQRADAGR